MYDNGSFDWVPIVKSDQEVKEEDNGLFSPLIVSDIVSSIRN